MMSTINPNPVTSSLKPEDAVYKQIIPAGEGWLYDLKQGQVLRIVDVEGNQAVDTLFIQVRIQPIIIVLYAPYQIRAIFI